MSRIEEPRPPGVSISITTAAKPSSSPRWIASSRYSCVTGLTSFSNSATRTLGGVAAAAEPENAAAAASAARAIRPRRRGAFKALESLRAAAVLEEVVERGAQADRERAGQHGRVAEARDLDARRDTAASAASRSADRVEQQVAVRADAAAEDDERDVGDGRDRGDVERDPARLLVDDLPRERVAGAGGGEDARGRRTAAAGSSRRRSRPTSRAASAETAAAHGSISSARPAATRSTSPAAPWRPRCSSPRSTSPAPRPVPTERKTKSSTPARDAPPPLADGGEVDVVLDGDRQSRAGRAGRRPRVAPSRPGTFVASRSWPVSASTTPGTPTTAPSISSRGQPARLGERVAKARRSRRSHASASAPSSSTSWRARIVAAQVADRAAQEAGAEVEAEHERRLRDEARRRRRRSSAGRDRARSRARARRRAATAARARRSASRCRPGARSRRARSARRRGSSRARCARSGPSAAAGLRALARGHLVKEPYS